MHGVLNLLKPPGMTSHDAVAFARRQLKTKRIGHTGTLDPAASGVLPLCIGQATRLVENLQAGTKEYVAEAVFGFETDTGDAVGKVLSTGDAARLLPENVLEILPRFRGELSQTPPIFSALKKQGKKLYELAREGADESEVEIPTRQVEISRLEMTQFFGDKSTPRAILHIECSGGTYIRSLVRDIGRALGTHATMSFLVRTRSGHFSIEEAVTLEQLAEQKQKLLIPMARALGWCAPETFIDDRAMHDLACGRTAELASGAERVAVWNESRTFAALAVRVSGNLYKPEKVFPLEQKRSENRP